MIAEDDDDEPILIALPLDDSEDALDLLGGALWTTAAVVLVFVLAIGLGAGLLVQRRLVRINGTLHRLAAGDLQARTGVERSSDDLDDLARQLDTTAGELERLVAQTRHLSASLAHDLRTPLARLRARLEMLSEGAERNDALEEAARLSGIFDTIMRVARIEAKHGTDGFEPVDLATLAKELADTFGPVVEDSGKQLTVATDLAATVDADRKMLVQALANLIQNAIVHGGTDITLFASGRDIGVVDNGTGVDPLFTTTSLSRWCRSMQRAKATVQAWASPWCALSPTAMVQSLLCRKTPPRTVRYAEVYRTVRRRSGGRKTPAPYQGCRNKLDMETTPMKSLLTKITSATAGVIVLVVGCAMAGLGLTALAFLAMVALAAAALAFLASPFLAYAQENSADQETDVFAEERSVA